MCNSMFLSRLWSIDPVGVMVVFLIMMLEVGSGDRLGCLLKDVGLGNLFLQCLIFITLL